MNDDNIITDIPKRSRMRRGQTPQAFKMSLLKNAYDIALNTPGLVVTCDCGVVRQALPDVDIAIVEGDSKNIKITEPLDIFLADKLFQVRGDDGISALPISKIENALKSKVIVIFGASYGIGMGIADIAEKSGAIVYRLSRARMYLMSKALRQLTIKYISWKDALIMWSIQLLFFINNH